MPAQFEIDATQPLADAAPARARHRRAALILLAVGAACYMWGRHDGFDAGAMVANGLPRAPSTPAARVADPNMGVRSFVKNIFSRSGSPTANANAVADGPTSRPWEQGWSKKGEGKQDFLEADPYHSKASVPTNTFSPKAPYTGKVVSVDRMVGPDATGETCHIVIDHGGNMPYYEGQSFGVIAPLIDQKSGKPAKTRLYSIASSRYGDDMSGQTASLCVRRATYWCPEMKAEDPAKKGVCSNWLCDAKPGDEIQLTGPTGKVMLMPEEDPNTDLIMIATGTGIAPYRGFIRRNFLENTPQCDAYTGLSWLFLGVANSEGLLYDDEFQAALKAAPDNFRVSYATSREGEKQYIQDKVKENGKEIFDRMEGGAHLYMCGLKGMLPGVSEAMQEIAKSQGKDWDETLKKWKKAGQWHIEVY